MAAKKLSLLDVPAPSAASLTDVPAPSAFADVVPGKVMAPGPWKPPSAAEVAAAGGPTSLTDVPAPGGVQLSPALAASGAQVQPTTVNGIRLKPGEPDKLGGLFPQGGDVGAAIKTTGTVINKGVNIASTPLSVAHAFQNQIALEQSKVERRLGKAKGLEVMSPADSMEIIRNAIKNTDWSGVAKRGATGKEFVPYNVTSIAAQQGPAGNVYSKAKINPAVMDFVLSFGADAAVGGAQNKLVGAIGSGLGKLDAATGFSKKVLAKLPALQREIEGRQAFKQAQGVMSRNAAHAESYLRDAADTAEDVRKTSQKYVKAGVPLRQTNPHTGQPVNAFDALVADYMDAGNPGSKHQGIRPPGMQRRGAELNRIAAEARRLGVDMADVRRIAGSYSGTLDTLGQKLVGFGLLSPQAYQKFKGQYLPRLYLLTKGNTEDVGTYLHFLEGQGALSPEALLEARARIGGKGFSRGTGPQQFNKARQITNFSERNAPAQARAMIPEATPAALHGISAQARAVGEASGHAEIAANPNLAVPMSAVTPEQAAAGWVPFKGKGPLEGHAIHPGVDNYLKLRNSDYDLIAGALERNGATTAARRVRAANKAMKALWISSPKTAVNNAVGNYELGSSAAAINGAQYSLPGYAKALAEIRAARKGGSAAPYLQEALDKTDILTEGSQLIPKAAKQVKGGFGVETAGEKLKALPGKAYEAYTQNAYQDVEKAGRYYLYKELREAGKTPEAAAKVVNAAMITYSDIGPLRRALEQNPIFGAPFITFPTKAVFQYLNTALRRPDKLSTYTGQRWSAFLDQLAGPEAVKRRAAGQEGGGVGPTDFPIPGMGYKRVPQLAPILQSLGSQPGSDVTDFGADRIWSAFPGPNLLRGLVTNQKDVGTGKTVPIVPPGSIPGVMGGPADIFRNKEVASAYGLQVAKSLLPEVSDLMRAYKAITHQPEYDAVGSPVPEVMDTVMRALTGATGGENIGKNALERSLSSEQRILEERSPELQRAGLAHMRQRFAEYRQNKQSFTPNAAYQRVADGIPEADLKTATDNATRSLGLYVSRQKGTPAEREARVKDLVDWIFALGISKKRRAQTQGQFLPPEQQQRFGALAGGG